VKKEREDFGHGESKRGKIHLHYKKKVRSREHYFHTSPLLYSCTSRVF
jgi:hypothetical protein